MPDFVEVVFIELSNEACKVAMLEMLGQYRLGEFLILQAEVNVYEATRGKHKLAKITSRTTKLSPSLPHLTTSL